MHAHVTATEAILAAIPAEATTRMAAWLEETDPILRAQTASAVSKLFAMDAAVRQMANAPQHHAAITLSIAVERAAMPEIETEAFILKTANDTLFSDKNGKDLN